MQKDSKGKYYGEKAVNLFILILLSFTFYKFLL